MDHPVYNPWLHRIAVLTACTAIFTIVVGTAVTSKRAGMAFPDWPTSDGYGMFAYPWLQSVGDKFLEHGHRLAGILIGISSLVLCASLAWKERRTWVKCLGCIVLLAVIAQGLLGGLRVLCDAEDLALIHGSGGALVFSLIVCVAVVTSRDWHGPSSGVRPAAVARLRTLAIAASGCVFVQYVLGGFLRHKGMHLYSHLGFAFVTALVLVWLAISIAASGITALRGLATTLALLTITQLGLGAAAWVTKFGNGDYVAVRGSTLSVIMLSLHVVTGALLLGTCVALSVRLARLHWCLNGANRNLHDDRSAGWPGLERSEAPESEESNRRLDQSRESDQSDKHSNYRNPITNRAEVGTPASIADVGRAGSPPGLPFGPAPATPLVGPAPATLLASPATVARLTSAGGAR